MSLEPAYGKSPEAEIVAIESIHTTPDRLRKAEADRARMLAAEAVALASMEVVKFLHDLMKDENEDTQARLRAADILMSRQIPKVAAKHATLSDEETVDTVDVQALRQSILAEVQKRR